MKVNEAITKVDDLEPNTYEDNEKLDWITELDKRIAIEILNVREREEDVVVEPYTEADMDKELLVPAPYDNLYVQWLMSQIDYYNNEMDRYANSAAMFNQKYQDFANYWYRTHKSSLRASTLAGGSSAPSLSGFLNNKKKKK